MARKSRVNDLLVMLETEPLDIFLNYSIGLEYFADENFSLAEHYFNKTIQLKTDYIPAYYQKGKLLEALQKNTEAIAVYKQGLNFAQQQKNNKAINEFGEAIFMLED